MVIQNRPNDRAPRAPHGENVCYIVLATEQYRLNKVYILKTRAEQISDTVEFFPQQFNMPKISSTDAIIRAVQDLFYGLHNPVQASPLVKLGNPNKESLRSLVEIFRTAPPPVVPPRVPFRGACQEKLQQVNQERTQTKNTSQSKPFTNAEPTRLPIVEEYP